MFLCYTFRHTYGTGRTYQTAEVASYTLGAYQTRTTGLMVEDNGLMATIATRYLAAATADTQLFIELWINNGVAVQMIRILELLQPLAHQLLQLCDAALGHIALQTQYQVVNDSIAVLHDGGTHLHVAATQLDEFQGVAPCLYAADAAQFRL